MGPVMASVASLARARCAPAAFRRISLHRQVPGVLSGHLGLDRRSFSEFRFTKTHEWFKIEADGTAVMGISDFAQGQLGEVVYCDMPGEGDSFKAQETVCTLESVKAVGEVYAPVDCEITEVNEKLSDEPALVNESPEEVGWLVKVKLSGSASGLMDRAAYDKHVEAEAAAE